uniref:Putative structural protein n=1 Tax=viral metagenome TaxID=1070528 RepID=A0A6M3JA30_9ZZZZ
MSAFLGMRGNGDWATDQRPKNWRETILYLYPNGSAPLTAILSKMSSEKVDDPEFN